MIAVPPGVRILLAARPVDFGNGLAALVQRALRADPFAGDGFGCTVGVETPSSLAMRFIDRPLT